MSRQNYRRYHQEVRVVKVIKYVPQAAPANAVEEAVEHPVHTVKGAMRNAGKEISRATVATGYEVLVAGLFELIHATLEATGAWDGLLHSDAVTIMVLWAVLNGLKVVSKKIGGE